jgi:glycosyltransferase involved in cell wall biosynthesis
VKISAVCPVLNEVDFIGYSIMACLENMHEFIYALDQATTDGTRELLHHIKDTYAHEKLTIIDTPTFHPSETDKYNAAFNACILQATGDAVWFLHPDMVVTSWPEQGIPEGALAWWTNVTSYARDFQTVISQGRTNRWKNIHARKFGLHYYGGYGSANEDFYHSDITGKSYKHYGDAFTQYPFQVMEAGISVNHYCELKGYKRRLEKMKLCLKTQHPNFTDERIEDLAIHHPRVTLEPSGPMFGTFEFSPATEPIPEVFTKYKSEFETFAKERANV